MILGRRKPFISLFAILISVLIGFFGGLGDEVLFGIKWLSDIVKSICSTGMAVAAIFGLILDNVIPGTLEERGIRPGKEKSPA